MRIFYLLIFSCFALFKLDAQIDTSFWFAAPKVPAPIGTTSVGMQFGTYSTAATVYVRQPANAAGVNYSFTLPANTSTVVNMTASVALFVNSTANTAANLGLYISSTGSISVNYIMESPVSKESISLKGKNGIGTDFYAPFTSSINTLYNGVAGNTGFDIVATESGVTTLLITPKGNLIGPRPKNNPFLVNLNQGQTFSCQEDLFTRTPVAAVTGLFDGDAFLDMAMVDSRFNNVIILKGTGTGGFTELATYTVAAQPIHIITDDVNNDSNRDLIIANYAGDNVSVLLGNGAGGFTSSGNFISGGNGANGVACADLNGDGNKDLVVTNNMSFSFGVLFGNGAGSFTLNATYTTPNQPIDIKISDFTNDGNRDVIVSNFGSNSVSLFAGTAAGTFPTAPVNTAAANGPYRMVVADFNGDTFEDVAVAQRSSNTVRVLLSNNVGSFTTSTTFAVGAQPESIVTCTVNGDANLDLVVSNPGSNNISILTGNGAGGFAAAVNNAVGTTPRDIVAGDFNNNGQFDFATPNSNSNNYSVLMGNGTTSPVAAVNTILGTSFYPCTELGASIISADKKISVSISGAVATNSVCSSYYSDQITNTTRIGMHYVIHRTNSASDQAYIIAPNNNTSLSITNATVTNAVMNSGDVFRVLTTNGPLTYIQTDKPVYVLSVGGHGCRLAAAQIAQAYCAGSYTASFERESSDSLFLDVYIRPAGIGTFTLDINAVPTLIPASAFTVVPGTSGNLFGARIYYNTATIPQGAYCILRNNIDLFGFTVQNGSNATGSHFSHHSNFNAETFVKAHPVATATICTNTSLSLNGVIGGGPNTGVWSSSGTGTFPSGPTALINSYVPSLQDTLLKPTPLPLGWTGGSVNIVLSSTGICPNISDFVGVRVLQGPLVNAGPDQIKCTNNATINLNGTVLGASSQGTWAVLAPGTGTFSNPSVLSTTYTPTSLDTTFNSLQFILTSINNGICNAGTDIIVVTLQKAPLVDAAPAANTVACANNATVYLNGYISNSIPTGIWSTNGSGVFIPNNISLTNYYVPSLTDISNSPIKLKLQTPPSALCKAVADSVFVFFTQPAIVSAGSDLNSCKNNPVINLNAVITGTSSNSVSWSGGTGTFVPSNTVMSPTYIATPTEIAAGFVLISVVTTSNGICAGVNDQVRVDFRDKPTAGFVSSTVCLNQPTQFNDQSINPSGIGFLSGWQWNFGNGNNSTQTSPALTYTSPGTYSVTLIVNNSFNCYDTLTQPYTVYPLANIKFGYTRSCTGSAQNICFTDSSTILPPSTIPATNHYWDFGGVGFSVTKDTCFIFPTDGKYSVTHQIISSNGCLSSVVQTINITPRPDARFRFLFLGQQTAVLSQDVQFIDSSKYAVSYFWDFGNGATSTQTNPVSSYNSNGTYTILQVVTDQFGCTDTYTLEVGIKFIKNDISELIPNIITPNADGKNDYWRLDFINVYFPKAEIEIFNRWGESIFRSTGYSNAWDGTYRGDPLPVGAYYYTIDLKDPDKPGVLKGNITLLK